MRVRTACGAPSHPHCPHLLMPTLVPALRAGKYLNAMRECGQHVARPVGVGGGGLQYDPHGQYVQQVWREGQGVEPFRTARSPNRL